MKVIRTVTYEGDPSWIEMVLTRSLATGDHRFGANQITLADPVFVEGEPIEIYPGIGRLAQKTDLPYDEKGRR